MLYSCFASEAGFGILQTGWGSETLRFFFLLEIVLTAIGIFAGMAKLPHKPFMTAVVCLGVLGCLMLCKTILFGLRSDAWIFLPFVGEALFVSAAAAVLVHYAKRRDA